MWVDEEIIGFDLETTGTDPFTAIPVSYALVKFDKGEVVHSQTEIINPECPIPVEASAIHGITTERARDEGVSLGGVVRFLTDVIEESGIQGIPIAGMNLAYDFTVLRSRQPAWEIRPFPLPAPVLDLMVIDKRVDKWRSGSRTLTALCGTYGVEFEDAHNAVADVVASVQCLLSLATKYPRLKTFEISKLHEAQDRWHFEQKSDFSKYLVEKKQEPPLEPWQFVWPVYGTPDRPPVVVRACRHCGCTDVRACPGGCWWVGDDVCSRCARA